MSADGRSDEVSPAPWTARGSQVFDADGVLVAAVRHHSDTEDRADALFIAEARNAQAEGSALTAGPSLIAGRIEHVQAYTVYPTGLDPATDCNASSFAVEVLYQGEHEGRSGGGWSVSRGPLDLLRSSAESDPQWDVPPRFRRWQFRFETFEQALAAARRAADSLRVNGRTYAEWEQYRAETDNTGA